MARPRLRVDNDRRSRRGRGPSRRGPSGRARKGPKGLTRTVILWGLGIGAFLALQTGGDGFLGLDRLFGMARIVPVASASLTGRAAIIDGDTLEIRGRRIRLHGIDAPEGRQSCQDGEGRDYRCGRRATAALSGRIGARTVSCSQRDIDSYGRVVAVCRAGGEDLNAWLVRQGWAVAYRRYSRDYVAVETEARSARRGIWAGSFVPPEDWRRR